MTEVQFVRIERDCGFNKDLRAKGDNRGIIYDFNVVIGGEHRATLHKNAYSVGYELYDADCRPIIEDGRTWRTHLGASVARKADFEAIISAFLEAGKIPTLEAMARLREQEEEKRLEKRRQILDQTRENVLNRHGIELYNALAAYRSNDDVRKLLAAIDTEVAIALAHARDQFDNELKAAA